MGFWSFFAAHRAISYWLLGINLGTFAAFAVDKYRAIQHRFRIRVRTLLGLSFLGGAAGGLLAMGLFRHKTRKTCFTVGLPLMLLTQIVLLFYFVNR